MTAPLTPPDCDLRDFPGMMVDIGRLFGSSFNASASRNPLAWMVGFKLWCRSWHQVPAASLPDDDDQLCYLAELGFDLKTFKKAKALAMHGWVKCSDGRLYHPTVAEKALHAWNKKLQQRWRTECERIKKHNHRHGTDLPRPTFEEWLTKRGAPDEGGETANVPKDSAPMSPGTDPPCPQGQAPPVPDVSPGFCGPRDRDRDRDRDREITPPERTAEAVQPTSSEKPPLAKEAWDRGVALLVSRGLKATPARTAFGKLLKDTGLPAERMLPLIINAELNSTGDPYPYLLAAGRAVAERQADADPGNVVDITTWTDTHWRIALQRWREGLGWRVETMGPPPGQPGCRVPPNLMIEPVGGAA